jgi:hypothetical protein
LSSKYSFFTRIIALSSHLPFQVSNLAAVGLYQKMFNYEIVKAIPDYYNDKESAYYMVAKGLRSKYLSIASPAKSVELE